MAYEHEKYLGGASDPGEWWCDLSSEAKDLGPGVSFSIRCGEDGGNGPHLICCYGLREDVRMDRVLVEAERILGEYQKPDAWHPKGRKLQGELRAPKLTQWRTLEGILASMADPKSHALRAKKASNVQHGTMIRSLHDIVYDHTGSVAMADRVIELAGLERIQAIYDACEVA